jgi:hypothetical protein
MNYQSNPPQGQFAPPPPSLSEHGFGNVAGKKQRWDLGIKWYDVPSDQQWHKLRFVGPLYMNAVHWFETKTKKKFPVICVNYDSQTAGFTKMGGCPVCELQPKTNEDKNIQKLAPRQNGYIHAIVRETQSFHPMRLPITAIIGIKKQQKLNKHTYNGVEYECDVTDPYYGQDVSMFYDAGAEAANRYAVSLSGHTPLQPHELKYLERLTDWAKIIPMPNLDEVRSDLRNLYLSPTQVQGVGVLPEIPRPGGMPIAPAPIAPPVAMPNFVAPAPQAYAPPAPMQMPPIGHYEAPQAPVAPQAYAPPAPAPVAPPQAFAPQPQAPVAPQAYAPPAPAPVAPPAPAPLSAVPQHGFGQDSAGSARMFQVTGRAEPLNATAFQEHVMAFCSSVPRTNPAKAWTNGDMDGMQVPVCFADYKADSDCMKCPVRKYCISY